MIGARARLVEVHWPLIGVVLVIVGLGIYNLHSAAAARNPDLYLTQATFAIFGTVFMLAVLLFDYRLTETIAYVFYAIVCLLLLAVLLQGREAGGARRWLTMGPMNLQPSELAKLAVVLCLARYFSHRLQERGYSLRELFRPLNVSRPLAGIAFLAVNWSKPWMVDPIGELARFIHAKPAAPPGELLWFRVAIILLMVVSCAVTIAVAVRLERQQALLDPWPEGRLKRLIILIAALFVALGGLLAVDWNAPFLKDPFGVALAALHTGAGPGGAYARLAPGNTLRVLLVLFDLAYLAAAFVSIRYRGERSTVDLLIAPIDFLLIPAGLVLVEPDLGTAGIIVLVGFTMILVVGVRLRSLLVMMLLGTMLSGVAWFGVLEDYQKRRIVTFIDPEHDIKGAGWNAVQSTIAVGSGRWWGKGHEKGTQSQLSFLPEQHTDFAFSVWAEEQGFVGCVVVLLLYLILLAFALTIGMSARDSYGTLLAVGVAALVLWQTLINVGMVIGMLPVVGLTLPLFSYGGSSLFTVMLGIGILLNVHFRRR